MTDEDSGSSGVSPMTLQESARERVLRLADTDYEPAEYLEWQMADALDAQAEEITGLLAECDALKFVMNNQRAEIERLREALELYSKTRAALSPLKQD